MNYNVNMEQYFEPYSRFMKSTFSPTSQISFPSGNFPLSNGKPDLSGKTGIPSPFFIGNVLHVPITLGAGTPSAGTIGFFMAKVNSALNLLENSYKALDSEEEIKKAGLKLSPQSVKMLQTVIAGRKPFEKDGHTWQRTGFKCKGEEIIKCLALGYLSILDCRQLAENLAAADYNFGNTVCDKKISNQTAFARVVSHMQTGDSASHVYRQMSHTLAAWAVRTAKVPEADCVIKWRRPSSTSKWPWTLDHHWFNSQESPIATAYYTMSSLLAKNNSEGKSQLMSNLPVFSNIRQLESSRKALEYYFANLKNILKPSGHSQLSVFCNLVNDLDWPGANRYSSAKKPTPEMFPVKACLTLGVLPLFDQSGDFVKFNPINGKLYDNQVKVYIEMDPNALAGRRPEIGLLLAYGLGILNLHTLETLMGPLTSTSAALRNDPLKVQLNLAPNVVCCLPMDCANSSTYPTLRKYGINHDCRCNTDHKTATSSSEQAVDISNISPYDLEDQLMQQGFDVKL